MDCDPSFLLTAVRCLPLLAVAREKIGQSLIALRGTKVERKEEERIKVIERNIKMIV